MRERIIGLFIVGNAIDAWMTSTYLQYEGVSEMNLAQLPWVVNGNLEQVLFSKAGIVAGVVGINILSNYYEHKRGRINFQYVSNKVLEYGNKALLATLGWNSINVMADNFQLVDRITNLIGQ